MGANVLVRQIHRWTSLAFTLAVVANLGAMAVLGQGESPVAMAIGFAALLPLLPLLATGIWLFVLPYVARARAA